MPVKLAANLQARDSSYRRYLPNDFDCRVSDMYEFANENASQGFIAIFVASITTELRTTGHHPAMAGQQPITRNLQPSHGF